MSKCFVEVEHLEELLPVDEVEVAVGEGPHVGHGLAHVGVLPEAVPEDVALPCEKETAFSFPVRNRKIRDFCSSRSFMKLEIVPPLSRFPPRCFNGCLGYVHYTDEWPLTRDSGAANWP